MRVKQAVYSELDIKKSRFIGMVFPIQSVDDAKALLHQLHKQHPKANHICYGMVSEESSRSSDDGEPSGTAGVAILEQLHLAKLDHCLGVVIRYFGGIKLGAGGLKRAYRQAIHEAIIKVEPLEEVLLWVVSVQVDYSYLDLFQSNYDIESIDYGSDVHMVILADHDPSQAILSLTKGQAKITVLGQRKSLR